LFLLCGFGGKGEVFYVFILVFVRVMGKVLKAAFILLFALVIVEVLVHLGLLYAVAKSLEVEAYIPTVDLKTSILQ